MIKRSWVQLTRPQTFFMTTHQSCVRICNTQQAVLQERQTDRRPMRLLQNVTQKKGNCSLQGQISAPMQPPQPVAFDHKCNQLLSFIDQDTTGVSNMTRRFSQLGACTKFFLAPELTFQATLSALSHFLSLYVAPSRSLALSLSRTHTLLNFTPSPEICIHVKGLMGENVRGQLIAGKLCNKLSLEYFMLEFSEAKTNRFISFKSF